MWHPTRYFCQILKSDKSGCWNFGDGCMLTDVIFVTYEVKIRDHSVLGDLKLCNKKNDSSD